jgi:hypothetical protein
MGLEGENLQSGLYGDASPRPEAKHRVGGVSSDSAAAVLNSIRRRPDCLAEVVGLELRNVVAKYPFERSLRFPGSSRILATETIRV